MILVQDIHSGETQALGAITGAVACMATQPGGGSEALDTS
jgi:hypothetical protein